MNSEPDYSIDLPIPWHWSNSEGLLAELYRELPTNHILIGCRMKTIAQRQDCDDVLFEVSGNKSGYAIVHLTWNIAIHRDVPYTHMFQSWDDVWLQIQEDARDFD